MQKKKHQHVVLYYIIIAEPMVDGKKDCFRCLNEVDAPFRFLKPFTVFTVHRSLINRMA